MEQYISKSVLVAEIKRRKEIVSDPILSGDDLMIGERNAYFNLLSFIDTLEVKEVGSDYIKDELDKAIKIYKPGGDFGWGTLYNIATHFFELGMAVSNKAQKGK